MQALHISRKQQQAGERHLWVCHAPIPEHIVDNNNAPRTDQVQELVKVGLVGPLIRICTM